MPEIPDIAALLGSRICHDLISPIGAIGNGVELLMMDEGQESPEIALISQSVDQATARIRFFRVAFGAAQTGQRMSIGEVQSILAGLTKGGRLQIDWHSQTDIARPIVKRAFLSTLCLETSMPYGGSISITIKAETISIIARSSRMRAEPSLWRLLTQEESSVAVDAAIVHFALLANDLARHDLRARVELLSEEIHLSL
jgi:histidine phosphotransferase ChpT